MLDDFEGFLRAQLEPLTYVTFFGALVVLGLIEAVSGGNGADRRRRWPANAGLTVLNIIVLGAMPVSVVAAADLALAHGWGLLNQPFVPPLAALVAGILLRSLVGYGVHVAMHKVPVLWRVHRVHHTDREMDVSTTVRFHPLEFLIATPVALVAAVLLGIPPVALMLYELIDAAMAVFTHARLHLPERLDRAARLVLVTPAMHRIHHSAWQPETDSNYGAIVTWWDRLFGTYRAAPENPTTLRLGLAEVDDGRANALWWLLRLPFRGAPRTTGPRAAEPRAAGPRAA